MHKFDWHKEPLSPQTIITDNYKNTQNVRRFFKENVHKEFKLNRTMMAWMKGNSGKTLSDAIEEYRRTNE